MVPAGEVGDFPGEVGHKSRVLAKMLHFAAE